MSSRNRARTAAKPGGRPSANAKRVDAFGNIQIGKGPAFRARLIQTSSTEFAVFPDAGTSDVLPTTVTFAEPPKIRGRNLTGTLLAEGPTDFLFQRASCGCQTPNQLRGPARRLLETLTAKTDA